jgi:hypothetical protein
MKKYLFAIFVVTLTLAVSNFAQSVVITPKKTVYRRPKPIASYKRTFTVIRPKVKAATPALSKKIETAISYEKVSELNIKEETTEVQWLEEASYTVNYNKYGILAITLSVTGTGAYPSTFNKTVVIDLKTGNRITPGMVFNNIVGLTAKGKKAQEKEVKQAIISIKKDDPDTEDPASLFGSTDYQSENLNEFSVSDKGVTFIYDYGFPHVAQALQPNGRYFFSWRELKGFIKPAGLFGRFVR